MKNKQKSLLERLLTLLGVKDKEKQKGGPFILSRSASKQPFLEVTEITLQDPKGWHDLVISQYPRVERDGDLKVVIIDPKGPVKGCERHHRYIQVTSSYNNVLVVVYIQIDNWTELWGVREVYHDYYSVLVDVWEKDGKLITPKRIHTHTDDTAGDNISHQFGRRKTVSNVTIDDKLVSFEVDGEKKLYHLN